MVAAEPAVPAEAFGDAIATPRCGNFRAIPEPSAILAFSIVDERAIGAHSRRGADHAGIREGGHGWVHRITEQNISAMERFNLRH